MKLLRIDSPLMRVLNKIADIMIVNLLFIICSFPVITVGAAATGQGWLHYLRRDLFPGRKPS